MKPVIERTKVICQCVNGHQWNSEILPGSTMPQTADCPECDGLLAFYPSLKPGATTVVLAAIDGKPVVNAPSM